MGNGRFLSADGRVEVMFEDGKIWVALNQAFDEKGVVTKCVTAQMDEKGAVALSNESGPLWKCG